MNSRLPPLPGASRRSSRDHNVAPSHVSESIVAAAPRPREACAQVFNSWLLSTDSISNEVSIGELMQSCQSYAMVARAENIDDLFHSVSGFARRLRAAASIEPRIIEDKSKGLWSIKAIRAQVPRASRGKVTLDVRTVKGLYADRKRLKVKCLRYT